MSPDFIKGLDMLKQMQSLTGCCDTQPPVVVYRDRPVRSFSIPEPGTPWWQTAKDCGAWTDRKDGDVGYVHFGSVEALRVYTVKVTRQALAAAAPQAPQQAETWRPIETAPKDGSLFLCWVSAVRYGETDEGQQYQQDASQADFCSWREGPPDLPGHGYFDPCCGQIADSQGVTHWMPLPAPPATPVA